MVFVVTWRLRHPISVSFRAELLDLGDSPQKLAGVHTGVLANYKGKKGCVWDGLYFVFPFYVQYTYYLLTIDLLLVHLTVLISNS